EVVEIGRWLAVMKELENLETIDNNPKTLHNIIPQLPSLVTFSFRSHSDIPYAIDSEWARLKEPAIEQIRVDQDFTHGATGSKMALINLTSHSSNATVERLVIFLTISQSEKLDGPIPALYSLQTLVFRQLELLAARRRVAQRGFECSIRGGLPREAGTLLSGVVGMLEERTSPLWSSPPA
ncbi:hypothetical protein FRB98_005329, partial [Tulasnella sp. 332]